MNDPQRKGHYPAQQNWQLPKHAEAYRSSRDPSKFHRYYEEEAIVNHWLAEFPPGALILDIPCGTGRFVKTITGRGLRYLGGDISEAMIAQARRESNSPLVQGFIHADAAKLPLEDNYVDCVIIWRLLHHIRDPEIRRSILSEARRVTRKQVLVSFHHPISFTFVRKFIKRTFFGRGHGSEMTQWRLKREAAQSGLSLVDTRGFRKYVSINWFASLRKI